MIRVATPYRSGERRARCGTGPGHCQGAWSLVRLDRETSGVAAVLIDPAWWWPKRSMSDNAGMTGSRVPARPEDRDWRRAPRPSSRVVLGGSPQLLAG